MAIVLTLGRCLSFSALLLVTLGLACGESGVEPVALDVGPKDVIAFGALQVDPPGGSGLYLVRPDGTELQRLSAEAGAILFPRWSPAGDRIAYVVAPEDAGQPGTLRVYDFATRSATTVSERALPDAEGPAVTWSGDGRRLAFAEEGAGIRVYDLERGEFVDTEAVGGTTPDWSPTRDQIAVIVDGDLHTMDADGGGLRRILERPGTEGNPRWSPDGTRLALWGAADTGGERRLLVIDRGGGDPDERGPGSAPVWSPAGDRIAYQRAADDGTNVDIYVIGVAGGVPRRLTESVALDSWPSWSPRGDRIAYAALVDQRTAFVCVLELEPGGGDCLDLPGLLPGAAVWSPE